MNHYFQSEHERCLCMEAAAFCLQAQIKHEDSGYPITKQNREGIRFYISPSKHSERSLVSMWTHIFLKEINEYTGDSRVCDMQYCDLFDVKGTAMCIYALIKRNENKIKGELL